MCKIGLCLRCSFATLPVHIIRTFILKSKGYLLGLAERKDGALIKFPVSQTGMNTVRKERANYIIDCSDIVQDHSALRTPHMDTYV